MSQGRTCSVRKLPPKNVLQAVSYHKKIWDLERVLRVYISPFGSTNEIISLKDVIAEIHDEIGLEYKLTTDQQYSDIRVGFVQDNSSWSYVGTDALGIPKTGMTMNMGWLNDIARHRHEWLHALGRGHEHQHPSVKERLKPLEEVLKLGKDLYGWDKDDVLRQIYNSLSLDEINSNEYDKASIMHYPLSGDFFIDGKGIGWNKEISPLDWDLIKADYPKKASIDKIPPIINIPFQQITLIQGDTIEIPPYEANDDIDGNITDKVEIKHNIDSSTIGEYQMSFEVNDSAGNNTIKRLPVVVLEDKSDNKGCSPFRWLL